VIWALLFYILCGSSGSGTGFGELATKYLEDQVKAVLPDGERRGRAVSALSIATDDIDDLNEAVSRQLKQFEKLVKDYDSKPADFDRLFETASDEHLRQLDKIWGDREALLEHIRPDEWKAIMAGARAEQAKQIKKEDKGSQK
jgi:hypothetical protein